MTKLNIVPLLKRLIFVGIVFVANINAFANNEPPQLSQAELEQTLAPIALYPDSILSHILVASTYPLEVVQAERWIVRNPELQGRDAVDAAKNKDWDPSVQALLAFPQILKRMSEDLEWTQTLGDAFLEDEQQVLASVQTLRELAGEAGSLDEMEKVTVTRDERTIIIEPREREIVYVPYYDTRSVYGHWRWHDYQPIYWDYPYADSPYYDDDYRHNRRSSFYWGPRISLSFGFFSNAFHWRDRHLIRISSRHYRPHRYYGHYDILGHHYANRWVHNGRRHGNRNRHIVKRNYRGTDRVPGIEQHSSPIGVQIRGSQTRQQPRQEQVRNQLANRRSTPAVNSNSKRISKPLNSARVNRPATNSRVVLPGRARVIEDQPRGASPQLKRPTTRQTTVRRANTAPTRAAQAAVRQPQARPAAPRSAPKATVTRPKAVKQATNKPAAKRVIPKPVAAERRGPQRAQSAARSKRRQPR